MRAIPITLIAMTVGFGLAIFELNPTNNYASDVNVYPFLIPILIGVLVFGLNKGIKRQKAIYDIYNLEFDDEGVTRNQINTPSIRLAFNEITSIKKSDLVTYKL